MNFDPNYVHFDNAGYDVGGLPTRLDVNQNEREECLLYNVFLDAVQQHECLVADALQGYIIKKKLNALGLPIKSNIGKNRFKTERFDGVVHFELKV